MKAKEKKTILVFIPHYLPGYKYGGPIRSIANLDAWLGRELHFKIITSDRDLTEHEPYSGIEINKWVNIGNAEVYYLDSRNVFKLLKILKNTSYDVVYLNSLFDIFYSFLPLLILKYFMAFEDEHVILAPRGQLSEGALSQKTVKKIFFINSMRIMGFYKKITWQATNESEKAEIIKEMGIKSNHIKIASNLPPKNELKNSYITKKQEETLKIIFLSRIAPKKNLDFALEVLQKIKKYNITFDIYGSITDNAYWQKCESLITGMPENITVNYRGSIKNEQVIPLMSNYHLFFFPTKGENFGHAIVEAMMASTPVLISDKTPWIDLKKKGLGWDHSLDNKQAFVRVIEKLAGLPQEHINALKKQVSEGFYKEEIEHSVKDNRKLFHVSEYHVVRGTI